MIDLYTWSTPNGRKASIMLEEIARPYQVHTIDILNDEQFSEEFLAISPNNKIPAIVDRENNLRLMESGAILIYLADTAGKFLPPNGEARWRTLEWLMFQMGGVGPMFGQAHHFLHFNPDASAYAAKRYKDESERLYRVMDKQLGRHEFLAGEYSIADIAVFPWVARAEWQQIDVGAYPNVLRWYRAVAARPAVQAGYKVPDARAEIPAL